MPDSLPFMRILHDFEGMDCKEHLKKALPNRAILSPPECLVSVWCHLARTLPHHILRMKSRILRPALLMVYNQPWTRSHVMVLNVNTRQRHSIGWSMLKLAMLFMMLSQLTRQLTMYSQVTRCLHLLNTVSADQHLPSPHPVVSGWLGPQRYQYRQYHCCGE